MDDNKKANGSAKSGTGGAKETNDDGENDDSDEDKENEVENHEAGAEGGIIYLVDEHHEMIA